MTKDTLAFDLASLDTVSRGDSGAELELLHPATGEGLGVYLTIAGVDSKAWRRASAAVGAQRAGKRRLTADDIVASGIEILARCTMAWRSGDKATVVVDGQELACSLENARTLFTRFPWAREQADVWASDRANYLRD